MAFADPQSVTIATVANSLPRTGTGIGTSSYTKDDSSVKLAITHKYGKRAHRSVRLDLSKIAADPLLAVNQRYGMSIFLNIDEPLSGFTVTERKDIVAALVAWATVANITKVLGGES